MKRRAVSFIIVLALCLSLCPTRVLAASWEPDALDGAGTPAVIASDLPSNKFTVEENTTINGPYDIAKPMVFDTDGHSYTATDATTLRVTDTGRLYLTTGMIESKKGSGIEVQAGGFLRVDQADMTVAGTAYGLDIASGATAELSGGTFTGQQAAIRTQDGDYGALLASGYAYFDSGVAPILLFNADGSQDTTEVAGAKSVTVKECTDHKYAYTAIAGVPEHSGICVYCGAEAAPSLCRFDFDGSNSANCQDCGHTVTVTTEPSGDLVYNGESQPIEVTVAVTLDGNTPLSKDNGDYDYTVEPQSLVNVGKITVTVTSDTFLRPFTKELYVIQDEPELKWDTDSEPYPVKVNYAVDKAALKAEVTNQLLSRVMITIKAAGATGESLKEYLKGALQFSYKKTHDGKGTPVAGAGFTDGLPTEAGTYEINASLPEQTNYEAAVTDPDHPITLIIDRINPFADPVNDVPKANTLIYDRTAQELVTPGTVWDGAVILFALGEETAAPAASDYSTSIPTGTGAGTYFVWYKVEGTNNYTDFNVEEPVKVTIEPKEITPVVELEYYTTVYDGGFKQPKVTVKDGEVVLPGAEYTVEYDNNQNVSADDSLAKVIITHKAGGNYIITPNELGKGQEPEGFVVTFRITPADQAGLTVTGQPSAVVYGDVFTLGTSGGSGNGTVTWEIVGADPEKSSDTESVSAIAKINKASGQVTVTGVGTVTVRATKSGTDNDGNHTDATAQWTFTAGKRPVTATVTAADKIYDGKVDADVCAVVEQGAAFDDIIVITVTGTFSDANAGTGKTVTVDIENAKITLNGTQITNSSSAPNEKYTVKFSSTAVTADIRKAATAVTVKTPAELTYKRTPQQLLADGDVTGATDVLPTTANLKIEYAPSKDGPWDEAIPQATDAGRYEVWYRVKESGNYLGTAAEKVIVTITPKKVTNPAITLSPDSYRYDGSEKKPVVTVKDGSDVIPASEYTVTYSNNVNVGSNATVTITDNAGGNYEVSGSATFSITEGQAVLTGTPKANSLTYNGQPQDLVSVGTASGGTVWYSSTGAADSYSPAIPKETNAGQYTVYYKVKGDSNHADTEPSFMYVTIQPKTVSSPVIQFADGNGPLPDPYSVEYNGSEHKPLVIVKDGDITIVGPNDEGNDPEYTVFYSGNVDAGTATVRIIDNNGGNYTVNGSKTFTINKATAGFAENKEPKADTTLTYTGSAQLLIIPGEAVGGTAVYSLNGGAYSTEIPTGTAASGVYSVKAKVLGDKNHEDSDPIDIQNVAIGQKTVTDPDIELSSDRFRYNGSEQKPEITIKDEKGNVIPASEYKVTYNGSTVDVGSYTIKIESRGINYSFTFTDPAKSTRTVTIVAADQETLTITGKPSAVYYGDTIQLSTTGGSGNGSVEWSIVTGEAEGLISKGDSEGQFIITGVGEVTVKAVRTPAAGSGYAAAEDTWTFYAYPKPVTAIVTAENKVYDGNANADLTVTVPGTDITIAVKDNYKGTFDSANVGTDKTVAVSGISSHVTITGNDENYYNVSYPATTTASITPAIPTVSGVAANPNLEYTGEPQDLVTPGSVNGKNGESGATVGYLVYSLDGNSYGLSVPTGKDAGDYTVWYKVMAGGNYQDSAPEPLKVTISPKTVSASALTVTCSPAEFPYDGTQKTPYITVKDTSGNVIPADEYIVTFGDNERIAIKENYTVKVTAKPGGNYKFTGGDITGSFKIVAADQAPLSIVVSGSLTVSYGDTFRLSTVGGSGTGAVKWESSNPDVAGIDPVTGVVTVKKGTGSFTVTAYKEGTDGSYGQSNTDSVTFTAKLKQITPVITVDDKPYDTTDTATVHVGWKSGDLADGDQITIKSSTGGNPTGTFSSADVGTNKQVTVDVIFEGHEGKYEIVLPALITGSIYKVNAQLTTVPQAKTNLVYNGQTQPLLAAGETANGIGTVEYSLSEKGSYSSVPPTGINAGTYTVWYRVAESVNWTGIGPVSVEVTIGKATPDITPPTASSIYENQPLSKSELTGGGASLNGNNVPGSFTWKNGEAKYEEGKSYEVIFTPDDQINYESVTIEIKIGATATETTGGSTSPDAGNSGGGGSGGSGAGGGSSTSSAGSSGGSTSNTGSSSGGSTSGTSSSGSSSAPAATGPNKGSASIQTSVRDGTASTVLNNAAGDQLVDEAIANQSGRVVIQPEISGGVTKTEVSIPAAAVSRIGNETDAMLTVSTPVADVSIPNGALDTLSSAGGTVSVIAERVENTVVLTLTVNGEEIGDIPGGLTLTVPVEDAGPGTVAVLVCKDGTRKTVRKSAMEGDALRIPLNGSVTVEIVDNSREFEDVSAESWAADAVTFASAHEMFNGTSGTTFSPEMTMSRAMLATVLYNLEGCPDQSLTNGFSDIGSDAWYTAGVLWAAENGITGGYDNGQFGPNDSITREQFVVMLWRYAGSPAADEQTINFTDADQASGYAMEALYWATANGILNGCGNGRLDPCGLATRAQAAQILKNFMENT